MTGKHREHVTQSSQGHSVENSKKQPKTEPDKAGPGGGIGWRPSVGVNQNLEASARQKSSDNLSEGLFVPPGGQQQQQTKSAWPKVLTIVGGIIVIALLAKLGVIFLILGMIVLIAIGFGKLWRSNMRRVIVGEARSIKERSEPAGGQQTVTIIAFHVERYDKAGNRMSPIPVEMRCKSFVGLIREGDQVEVRGKWREGEVLRVSKVYNLTTRSRIKKGASSPLYKRVPTFIGWCLYYLVYAAIIAGIILLVKSMFK